MKVLDLKKRIERMSVNHRVAMTFRIGVLAIAGWMALNGRPPMSAQTRGVEQMVSAKDADQDIKLSKFDEFRVNQEHWNEQTGRDLSAALALSQANNAAIGHINGTFAGGLGIISLFTGLAVFFQLKKKS